MRRKQVMVRMDPEFLTVIDTIGEEMFARRRPVAGVRRADGEINRAVVVRTLLAKADRRLDGI